MQHGRTQCTHTGTSRSAVSLLLPFASLVRRPRVHGQLVHWPVSSVLALVRPWCVALVWPWCRQMDSSNAASGLHTRQDIRPPPRLSVGNGKCNTGGAAIYTHISRTPLALPQTASAPPQFSNCHANDLQTQAHSPPLFRPLRKLHPLPLSPCLMTTCTTTMLRYHPSRIVSKPPAPAGSLTPPHPDFDPLRML